MAVVLGDPPAVAEPDQEAAMNPADQVVHTLGAGDLAMSGVVPDEAGLGEHHRQEGRHQHLPPRLPETGERSPAGRQQQQVHADLEAVVARPQPEQASFPLHRPRQLRVVASGTNGGHHRGRACTARGLQGRVCGQPCPPRRALVAPASRRASACLRPARPPGGRSPAAAAHLQVLAGRGTVNQSAWTWSACGPLGPWLTVYSTFWLSVRVR